MRRDNPLFDTGSRTRVTFSCDVEHTNVLAHNLGVAGVHAYQVAGMEGDLVALVLQDLVRGP
jgi:hypothetical protein